jgi:hypothetical protein
LDEASRKLAFVSTTSADTERHQLLNESIGTFVPEQADKAGGELETSVVSWIYTPKTYLYLIVADTSPLCFFPDKVGQLFKVGISVNPSVRLRSLQTGNPFRLSFWSAQVAWGPDAALMALLERTVHSNLSHLATVGEWFFGDPQFAADLTERVVVELECGSQQ